MAHFFIAYLTLSYFSFYFFKPSLSIFIAVRLAFPPSVMPPMPSHTAANTLVFLFAAIFFTRKHIPHPADIFCFPCLSLRELLFPAPFLQLPALFPPHITLSAVLSLFFFQTPLHLISRINLFFLFTT